MCDDATDGAKLQKRPLHTKVSCDPVSAPCMLLRHLLGRHLLGGHLLGGHLLGGHLLGGDLLDNRLLLSGLR